MAGIDLLSTSRKIFHAKVRNVSAIAKAQSSSAYTSWPLEIATSNFQTSLGDGVECLQDVALCRLRYAARIAFRADFDIASQALWDQASQRGVSASSKNIPQYALYTGLQVSIFLK